MKNSILTIKNLKASIASAQANVEQKEILKGVDLEIKSGEVHAIMGPNGAGKTTLAMSLMGHPGYATTNPSASLRAGNSQLTIDKDNITSSLPEERAKKGLFVSFQHPVEITGVSVLSFLRTAYKELHPSEKIPLSEFKQQVKEALKNVSLSEDFMQRSLNEGFSGGEKKRAEIVQLLVLKPRFVILDEIDSGLDIDSLRIVAQAIKKAAKMIRGDSFLVLNGDIITDIDIKQLYKKKNSIALIELKTKFGTVELADDKIKEFREKKPIPNVWMNAGIYHLDRKIIKDLPTIGAIENTTFLKYAKADKLHGIKFNDTIWFSIDSHKDLEDCSETLKAKKHSGHTK